MKRFVARACLALLVLSAQAAFADETSAEAEQRRTQLFKEGRALGDAGKWSEASEKFRGVVAIRSAPKALVALAVAEERQGHLVEAKRLYEKARFDARLGQLKDDEESAGQALRQLEPRLPGAALHLPSDVRGVSVTIDGKPAELKGGEIDFDPGDHEIVVSAPGRADFRTSVTGTEGQRSEIDVPLPPTSSAITKPKPDEASDSSSSGFTPPPLGVIVVGGAGVALGIAGIALLAAGKGQERDVMDACGGVSDCPLSLKPDADASARKIIAGDVLLGVGGAALIGGGVWWFLSRSKPAAPASSEPGETSMTIGPLRGGAWASVETKF